MRERRTGCREDSCNACEEPQQADQDEIIGVNEIAAMELCQAYEQPCAQGADLPFRETLIGGCSLRNGSGRRCPEG